MHGFGSNCDAGNTVTPARMLSRWGYVTLRFSMRGCGGSQGEFGRIICKEQVEDTRHAITWFMGCPEVEAGRVGLIGSSFGAAVALYTAGVDERPSAVVSASGWGDGETKFRAQHPGREAWEKFTGPVGCGAGTPRTHGRIAHGVPLRYRAHSDAVARPSGGPDR